MIGLFYATNVWSHSGEDLLVELQKNNTRLSTKQMTFFQLESKEGMSKYKLDYIEVLAASLKTLRLSVK